MTAMASRGRRGGAPARDDEQRRDDQAEQQAPAPRGPVLPPPPPVDYGVFMQGLVQAMQTQAHTQAALQAQLEAQPWLPVDDVEVRQLATTSRGVMIRRSNRPQHHEALCFPHRRQWTMECSCKVWCRPCRPRREHHILECPLLKEHEMRNHVPKKQGRLQALRDEEAT
ncbi:hypothetical protein Taro_008701, partial [Colocasia esculenta]|nr:hypothetical protein [Colocasia esculenta]